MHVGGPGFPLVVGHAASQNASIPASFGASALTSTVTSFATSAPPSAGRTVASGVGSSFSSIAGGTSGTVVDLEPSGEGPPSVGGSTSVVAPKQAAVVAPRPMPKPTTARKSFEAMP